MLRFASALRPLSHRAGGLLRQTPKNGNIHAIACPLASSNNNNTSLPSYGSVARVFSRSFSAVTKYSKDHEYVRLEGGVATIGITDHAQNLLGEIVYVELPEVDEEFESGDSIGSVDSVKTASDVYTPLSGTVMETNVDLADNPGLVNEDAEGKAWFVKLECGDSTDGFDELLSKEEYDAHCEEDDH